MEFITVAEWDFVPDADFRGLVDGDACLTGEVYRCGRRFYFRVYKTLTGDTTRCVRCATKREAMGMLSDFREQRERV